MSLTGNWFQLFRGTVVYAVALSLRGNGFDFWVAQRTKIPKIHFSYNPFGEQNQGYNQCPPKNLYPHKSTYTPKYKIQVSMNTYIGLVVKFGHKVL